jgi:hypothetical protein
MIKIIKNILNSLYQVLGLPYIVIKKVLQVLVQVLKKSLSVIGSLINKVADLINKGLKGLINGLLTVFNWIMKSIQFVTKYFVVGILYLPKLLKAVGKWLVKAIKESIAQIFTLLGFFIAWLTLTGSAKDIVGIAIIISTAVWLLTISLREDD